MANVFLASSTLNDMFTHFDQLRYLDFYTLIKLHICHFTARSVKYHENFKLSGTSKKTVNFLQDTTFSH
jgi:hypothetical protein